MSVLEYALAALLPVILVAVYAVLIGKKRGKW